MNKDNYFSKEDLTYFKWEDLEGLKLELHVKIIDGAYCVIGKDVNSDNIYLLKYGV